MGFTLDDACRHDFYNTTTEVVLSIYAKNIPKEQVFVDFGEQIVCSMMPTNYFVFFKSQ